MRSVRPVWHANAGRSRSRLAVAGLLLLSAGLLAPPQPPAAAANQDLQAGQERVDREVAEAAAVLEQATERAKAAAAQFAAADAALPAAQKRVDQARGVVVAAQTQAHTAERAAETARAELAAAGVRVVESVAAVDRARERAAAFAVAAYKGSRLASANLLLRARGPAEAVSRLGYLDQVAGVERERVDELVTARLAARQAENQAALARERAEAARRATAAALSRAQAAEAAAELAATEADALAEQRAGALRMAEGEREESLRRYQEAEAEAARIEAELQAWQARQPPPAAAPAPREQPPEQPPPPGAGRRSAAGFVLPTHGWQSSPFGMRFDPFFGVWQLHAGVDIAAPGGTPVYAVTGGTVIRAGWNGGYGNFTCLGHGSYQGQGLATCYAHQSEILVGSGQWVRRGEVIGRVGTSGASTGNHLHFEVRLDGTPTDPIPYLPPL